MNDQDQDLDLDQDESPTQPGSAVKFLAAWREHQTKRDWVKLILSKCHGELNEVERVEIRPVEVRGQVVMSLLFRFPTRDETRNMGLVEFEAWLTGVAGVSARSAHLLCTEGEVHGEWSRKGKETVMRKGGAARAAAKLEHNREKRRFVDSARPWLRALGLTDSAGRVVPGMTHKWKQVNRFVEVLEGVLKGWSPSEAVRVLDFGSGKGYLTFALYYVLTERLGFTATVVGVEIRPDMVAFCNRMAQQVGYSGLSFRTGTLEGQEVEGVDVLIALHACDVATDMAIRLGVEGQARLIVCSPCCHKEIRPQLQAPAGLQAMLRFGVHQAQAAEMVTDTLRALAMESRGYSVQVFEFISLEHTDKNKMILGVRSGAEGQDSRMLARQKRARREYAELKGLFGVASHYLEGALGVGQEAEEMPALETESERVE